MGNTRTSRGSSDKFAPDAILRKVKGAAVPEVLMDSANYEEWNTSGVPHLSTEEGKKYIVELDSKGSKAVWREKADPELPEAFSAFHIMGTMTSWDPLNLSPSSDTDGLFTYDFTLGSSGQESFQIALDHDPDLNLYPETTKCTKKATKVLGPATAPSKDYAWLIKGEAGTKYTVELFRATPSKTSITWYKTTDKAKAIESAKEEEHPPGFILPPQE